MTTPELTQIRIAPTLHWLEAFGLWLRQQPTKKGRPRSQKTLASYQLDVQCYQRYFQRINTTTSATLEELLNSTDLKTYFTELETSAKPATYNRRHASLSLLVKFAQAEGLLAYNPLAWIPRLDAVRSAPRDLHQDEQETLKATLSSLPADTLSLRDKLLVELMLYAGLRIHEVIGLKASDLHLDKNYISVLGKGHKYRDIPIGTRLVEALRTWLDQKPAAAKEALFTGQDGPLTTGQARRRFYAIRDTAGLEITVTPHALRHTYINNLLTVYMSGDSTRLGTAIKAVCQLTGDRPEVILAYYTNPRASDIRAAVEAL